MATVCGNSGAIGQGGFSQVPYQSVEGGTFNVAGPTPTQILFGTSQVIYSAANPLTGVAAAGTTQSIIYPFMRTVSSGGLVNGQTVVDIVMPNGANDPGSFFTVVYTIAGGVLT